MLPWLLYRSRESPLTLFPLIPDLPDHSLTVLEALNSILDSSCLETYDPASNARQSKMTLLRQGLSQASVLSESKPEAQDEVSTATPRTSESVP